MALATERAQTSRVALNVYGLRIRLEGWPEAIEAGGLSSDAAEVELTLRLGRGDQSALLYFSDLTHGYVELNSEYTT